MKAIVKYSLAYKRLGSFLTQKFNLLDGSTELYYKYEFLF